MMILLASWEQQAAVRYPDREDKGSRDAHEVESLNRVAVQLEAALAAVLGGRLDLAPFLLVEARTVLTARLAILKAAEKHGWPAAGEIDLSNGESALEDP